MANLGVSFVQLLWKILNHRTGAFENITFQPQKPSYDFKSINEQPLPRSTPAAEGIDASWVEGLVRELGENKNANMHQLTILRHEKIIYEGGFDPYPAGIWHVTYSMCKSFTGLAIGLLVDDGLLHVEDKVVNFFRDDITLLHYIKFRDLSVRDLLVMSSGSTFNEVGAISGDDWVSSFFESSVKFAPGSEFDYNSMNSFMLSAIVQKVTGTSMFDLLKERIFNPMGIKKVFWEHSPQGVTKGGWGMFLRQEDAAKLGLLFMNKGIWNGTQLVSEQWITDSISPLMETGNTSLPGYGYQLWTQPDGQGFCFNGMLGQNVQCYYDLDLIIVTNAGNQEVFQGGGMTDIIKKYTDELQVSATPIVGNVAAYRHLLHTKQEMEGKLSSVVIPTHGGWCMKGEGSSRQNVRSRRDFLKSMSGKIFEMDEKGIGLFPLIMQVVHYNFTEGIRFVRFRLDQGTLYLDFMEGNEFHVIPVGFDRGRHTTIHMNGEDYLVGCKGQIGINEDQQNVLSIKLCFVEEATERSIKIIQIDDYTLEFQWNELPGSSIIVETLESITSGSGNMNLITSGLLSQVSPDLIKRTFTGAVKPVTYAREISRDEALEKIRLQAEREE